MSTTIDEVRGFRSAPLSAARLRIVTVATDLFAQHGVSATSLQMIADTIGVTKAAVYHQFKTKEAIVVAAIEMELGRLERALNTADRARGDKGAVEALLNQVIELAVDRRRMVGTLMHDPVMARLLAEHAPFQQFMERLHRALLGGDDSAQARVRVAMAASAIGGAVTHPLVAGLDEATLRTQLVDLSRRFLGLDGP